MDERGLPPTPNLKFPEDRDTAASVFCHQVLLEYGHKSGGEPKHSIKLSSYLLSLDAKHWVETKKLFSSIQQDFACCVFGGGKVEKIQEDISAFKASRLLIQHLNNIYV